MKTLTAHEAYAIMVGGAKVAYPPIPFAFAEGEYCMNEYSDMLDAYERLRKRLGVQDEDRDVEDIINAFLNMQRELCFRMFRYGAFYGAVNRVPVRVKTRKK